MNQKPVEVLKNKNLLLEITEPDSIDSPKKAQDLSTLPLSLIDVSSQPRRYFDPVSQEQLEASIRTSGILQPIIVRLNQKQRYELIVGERRYRAALKLGLEEVPVVVKKLNDTEARTITLIENLNRDDLNPVEETQGILELLAISLKKEIQEITSLLYAMDNQKKKKITDNVMGKEETLQLLAIFHSLGRLSWESFVSNRLPLLNLPQDILTTLREGKIEYTKARAIAKVKDEEMRNELLSEAIAQELSLTQIKERLEVLNTQTAEPNLLLTPQKTLSETYTKLKKSQLWKKDPKKWRKAQTLLKKLEELLDEELEEIVDS